MDVDAQKRAAAERALALVEPGMRVGLGTGSTAYHFVAALGARVAGGLDVLAVPTSEATRRQAEALGIRLATLDECPELDLTVDGADEIDPAMRLIKGGGGALLFEKLVASASRRMIVITDGSKQVAQLGRFPLPVEVMPFGYETTRRRIAAGLDETGHSGDMHLRRTANGTPFVTDGGHWIVDLHLAAIAHPERLALALKSTTGVVEHGLFLGLATGALIGRPTGLIETGII